jgi:hypothetical protein
MELIVIATTLALSIGLGLAGARGMLSVVFFLMERSIAAGSREALALARHAA